MKKYSALFVGITLVVALLTLLGWLFNLEFLKRPAGGQVVMLPITAISIVLGALSFFLLFKMGSQKAHLGGKILAFCVLCVGLLKLLTLIGLNTGLERWLYHEPPGGIQASTGPLSAQGGLANFSSAVGFLLTGAAMLLAGLKGRWPARIINYLAVTGLIMGAFIFIGYIYQVKEFYGPLSYLAVSPLTALCYVCFALGVLFQNSDVGFVADLDSPYQGGRLSRILIPVSVLIPFIMGYFSLRIAGKYSLSGEMSVAIWNTARLVVVLIVLWILARALNTADEARQKSALLLEQQAQLFNLIPDAVFYGNKDFTVTGMNPAARRILNALDTEIGCLQLDQFFTTSNAATLKETAHNDLWGEKGFWRGETELTTRSGEKINALAMLKSVSGARGEKATWIGVFTDISVLHLNEKLKLANNYLEQLAFISAHDIKSPVITLKGLNNLMYRSGYMQPDGLQVLEMQRKVIDEMQLTNKGLNDILMLRKNLESREAGDSGRLPFGKIISNILALLQTEIELSGAALEMDIKEVEEMKFPQIYFQSLFYNLISNALKYRAPERPLFVSITGRRILPNTVIFTVEDNGLGFDATNNKHKIFGIFKRFHTHTEGTGVGLHIVKSIVDAFNGRIEVQSEPGVGTKFELEFRVPVL